MEKVESKETAEEKGYREQIQQSGQRKSRNWIANVLFSVMKTKEEEAAPQWITYASTSESLADVTQKKKTSQRLE